MRPTHFGSCPLLALSERADRRNECLLLAAKQTLIGHAVRF
jgi:hypothetical protein